MSEPASSPPTGTVAFLFTDIEGSTRLVQRLGERYHRLIEDHNRLLREAFEDGYVVRTEGDAFFVVFRTAPAAVAAAVEAQRRLAAHEWTDGSSVKVRMGIHTGEGSLAGGDYAGIDVHRAARIADAGHGGQVLVSEATRSLAHGSLRDGIGLVDLGEHLLKDLPEPEHLYQVSIPGLPGDFPPLRSIDARPNNLPVSLTPFIGREELLAELEAACLANRLVTLTGPGGTGKTRLSLQAASELLDRFSDGAFVVYLAPIVEPELVPATIAKALDVMEERERPVLETLKQHLRDKDRLLVLDNFEQIVDAAPAVAELLAGAERLRCLVSSREALRIQGEQEFPVPPMTLPDPSNLPDPSALAEYESVALFLQRARAVRPDFSITPENATALAEICRRLDGLPLAIELAASRVRLLSPQRILDRLEPLLPILSGGGRDVPARQQTLRNTIGWSFDLLDEIERAAFRRLSVFRGGCTLEAAEAVCDPAGELGTDPLEVLGSLVDKSLARQVEQDDDEPRFVMLHVIREYAMERLEETDETDEIRRRHAEFFSRFAEQAAAELTGDRQAQWLDRLEAEHDNLRAALGWLVATGSTERALRLVGTLWRFWQMREHLREAKERFDEVLALPDVDDHPEAKAHALEGAGGVAYWMGDFAAGERLYGECLELRRSLGDPRGIGEAAYNLACIYAFSSGDERDTERADRLLEEAEELFRGEGDSIGIAKTLWARGGNHFIDDPEITIAPFQESLARYREAGDRFGEAWSLHMLGMAEALAGRTDEARAHVYEAMDLFLAADDRSAVPILLNDLSIIAALEGSGERALRLAGAAGTLERETGLGLVSAVAERTGVFDRMWSLLPREEAERHYAEGQALSADEAIAYGRKEDG